MFYAYDIIYFHLILYHESIVISYYKFTQLYLVLSPVLARMSALSGSACKQSIDKQNIHPGTLIFLVVLAGIHRPGCTMRSSMWCEMALATSEQAKGNVHEEDAIQSTI